MIHDDLLTDVRIVLQQALKSQAPAKRQSLVSDDTGRSERLTIEVIRFRAPPSQERFFHVLFRAEKGAGPEVAQRIHSRNRSLSLPKSA